MTTKEFAKEIEKLGMSVETTGYEIEIQDSGAVGRVDTRSYLTMDTNFINFDRLDTETKEKLFNLLYEYASTPVEDRGMDDKGMPGKYYLRLKGSKHLIGDIYHLNQNINSEIFSVADKYGTKTHKTKFTQEEIDRIPAELLEIFDKVKVEG